MRRSVLTAFVSAFLAVAAFAEITTERAISNPVYGPTAAAAAQIASNGDGFFEVWSDRRDQEALYASAITRTGTVLNPSGILLAKGSFPFAVAWSGNAYLVVWTDASKTLFAERFAADGELIAPARAIASNVFLTGRHPLSTNGNVSVLTSSGTYYVLDAEANVIATDHAPGLDNYLTASGEFLLTGGARVRLDSSGRFAKRVDRAWPYPIACRPTECLGAAPGANGQIEVMRYDPVTLMVDFPVTQLPITGTSFDLLATVDGYIIAFYDGTVYRLDPDGHPAGAPIVLPGGRGTPHAATNGTEVVVVRATSPMATNSIIITASSISQYSVGRSANAQRNIQMAKSASNYLAVWSEDDGTYAGRLSLDGVPLDGRGTLLSADVVAPSVIYDGSSYLIVVHGDRSHGSSQAVIQVDPTTGAITSRVVIPGSGLRIGSNGAALVGVWVDLHGQLVSAFLYPNGAVASAVVPLASPLPNETIDNLSLAWNGTIWLVGWTDDYFSMSLIPHFGGPIPIRIRAVRLSLALIPLDTEPITLTSAPLQMVNLRAASDGHDFLVAWTVDLPVRVRIRRVLASGVPDGAEKPLVNGVLQDLVWDGATYDLAFETLKPFGVPGDLAGARLSSTGQPIETLLISATPDDDRSASLVPIGIGRVLAAYTRVAYEPLYAGVERAFVGPLRPVRKRTALQEGQ